MLESVLASGGQGLLGAAVSRAPGAAELALAAIALAAISGLPGLVSPTIKDRWATAILALGSLCGLGAVVSALAFGADLWTFARSFPLGSFAVRVDAISAAFLLPLFIVAALASVYAEGYFAAESSTLRVRVVRAIWGFAIAGMALVFVANDSVLFLLGWEVMALGSLFLVLTEHHEPSARHAGYVYLVATHTGTLCLFAAFILLGSMTGGTLFTPVPPAAAHSGAGSACFILALVGFGIKAGLMPFHVWLPVAHAAAPSPVSALMSGVLIKTGIYGLVRLTSLFPDPPAWWGGTVFVLGVVSGIGGVAYALGQHDIKRLLAYHSVENIGIIAMGLGLALVGRTYGRTAWIELGMGAALFHVLNHALFKSLLFLGAGSVIHATHTREMDHLGGLLKKMPWTGATFLVAAVAISGLPPLNGFVSELLLYLAMLDTLGGPGVSSSWLGGVLALPALALIGAMALACFVKAFGAVFLGLPRSEHAEHAHEANRRMVVPMVGIAALCVLLGLAPQCVMPLLNRAAGEAAHLAESARIQDRAPLTSVSSLGVALVVLCALLVAFVRAGRRARTKRVVGTWDCGYAKPAASMQYTSSSFAGWYVRLFGWWLWPSTSGTNLAVRLEGRPSTGELFPEKASFASHVGDVILDRALVPAFAWVTRLARGARWLQQGKVQTYLVYIFITLVVLLTRV